MDMIDAYSHATASLAFWAILVCVLAAYSTIGRTSENRCACGKPKRDYSDPVYRRERAFMNAVEGGGPFVAATVAAILIGAAPFWVNLFATVYLVARIAVAVVHTATTNEPLRSLFFMIGFFAILGQAVIVLIAVF